MTSKPRDFSSLIVIAKAGLVLAIGLGGIYWMKRQPAPSRPAAPMAAPAAKRPAVSPLAMTAAVVESPDPAPSADPPAHEPTAMERVLAAAEASKRREAATDAAPVTPAELEDVISRAMPAVVRVETPGGIGSGFFIAADTLLTNVHVVGTNSSVTIRKPDGKAVMARVDTTAPELDIAVVRVAIPDSGQPTLTLGSGVHARAGQEVITLGSPLGLQNTVTRGIVSAVREVGGLTLVQTDAAINPGNSGGPLIDRTGRVVGITTMGLRSSVAQGLSFAIAIEHAQALLAGKRTVDAHGTPISALNEAMSGRKAPGEAEVARDAAARGFEQTIAALARRADALDDRWNSFKRSCYEGAVAGTFVHEWFALWEPRAMRGAVSPGCEGSFADIRRVADDIRDRMIAAGEAARQSDVYPGTRRELLHRYRLEHSVWER
jgi:S1-C subfamily serine protease